MNAKYGAHEKMCKNTHRMYHVVFLHPNNVMGKNKSGGRKEKCIYALRIGSARSIAVNYRYQTSENTQTDRIARMQVSLLLLASTLC